MNRINPKAQLLGIGTDIGGTIVASMILLSLFGGGVLSQDLPPEEMERAIQQVTQRGSFLIVSLVVGLGFTGLGGYVAARVAKQDIYLNAGLVGVFSLLLGAFLGGGGPIWFNVAGMVFVVPAALYGGYFADVALQAQAGPQGPREH